MNRQVSSRPGNRSNRNVNQVSEAISGGSTFITSILIICSNCNGNETEEKNSENYQNAKIQENIVFKLMRLAERKHFNVKFSPSLPSPGDWTSNIAIIIITELDASNIKYKKSKYIKTQYEDLSINEEMFQHNKNNYEGFNNVGVHSNNNFKKDIFSVASSSSYGGRNIDTNSQTGGSQIETDNEAKELLWIQETSKDNRIFKIIFSTIGSRNPVIRDEWLRLGANMVTESYNDVTEALETISDHIHTPGGDGIISIFKNNTFKCPYCNMSKLSSDAFWYHVPLFHSHNIRYDNTTIICPICKSEDTRKSFFEHLQFIHMPEEPKEVTSEKLEGRQSATIKLFALLVCRRYDGKFLMVDEVGGCGWWLPGGRVDAGKTLQKSIVEKTFKETGINIKLESVLKIEFFPNKKGSAKLRVIFFATPQDPEQKPKTIPDYESNGACWVSLHQLHHIKLRSSEPAIWFPYVARGGPVYPLDILRDIPTR